MSEQQYDIPAELRWHPGEAALDRREREVERREQQLGKDRAALSQRKRQVDREARMVAWNKGWLAVGWAVVMLFGVYCAWLYQSAPR